MAATNTSSVRSSITHVIFDMDGLLLDTETFYTVAQTQILSRYGKSFTWDLKAKMMGKKAMEAATVLVQECELEGVLSAEEFVREREEILHQLFPNSQLMPGAERLVRHLHCHGIPIAVATSSHNRHFQLKTSSHGAFFSLMHHVLTGDDVTNGKPAPDIFIKAAREFEGPTPESASVLVFEDAPTGVTAAKAAGMFVVMVPDKNLDRNLCCDADEVIDTLMDFVPEHWGLPPF